MSELWSSLSDNLFYQYDHRKEELLRLSHDAIGRVYGRKALNERWTALRTAPVALHEHHVKDNGSGSGNSALPLYDHLYSLATTSQQKTPRPPPMSETRQPRSSPRYSGGNGSSGGSGGGGYTHSATTSTTAAYQRNYAADETTAAIIARTEELLERQRKKYSYKWPQSSSSAASAEEKQQLEVMEKGGQAYEKDHHPSNSSSDTTFTRQLFQHNVPGQAVYEQLRKRAGLPVSSSTDDAANTANGTHPSSFSLTPRTNDIPGLASMPPEQQAQLVGKLPWIVSGTVTAAGYHSTDPVLVSSGKATGDGKGVLSPDELSRIVARHVGSGRTKQFMRDYNSPGVTATAKLKTEQEKEDGTKGGQPTTSASSLYEAEYWAQEAEYDKLRYGGDDYAPRGADGDDKEDKAGGDHPGPKTRKGLTAALREKLQGDVVNANRGFLDSRQAPRPAIDQGNQRDQLQTPGAGKKDDNNAHGEEEDDEALKLSIARKVAAYAPSRPGYQQEEKEGNEEPSSTVTATVTSSDKKTAEEETKRGGGQQQGKRVQHEKGQKPVDWERIQQQVNADLDAMFARDERRYAKARAAENASKAAAEHLKQIQRDADAEQRDEVDVGAAKAGADHARAMAEASIVANQAFETHTFPSEHLRFVKGELKKKESVPT